MPAVRGKPLMQILVLPFWQEGQSSAPVGGGAAENFVAYLKLGDVLAYLHHGAHIFVAQHHGKLHKGRNRAGLEELHVCTADTYIVNFDHKLVCTGMGDGLILQPGVVLAIKIVTFIKRLLSRLRIIPAAGNRTAL